MKNHDTESALVYGSPTIGMGPSFQLRHEIAPKYVKPLVDAQGWVQEAMKKIERDSTRSSDTHLLKLHRVNVLRKSNLDLYLKDESTHPSGSLKHRLAKSLFIFGLCNGWIGPDTTIIEASSGSTAVSEAYFASLLGLRFIAVMPKTTSQAKIELIKFYFGECHLVEKASDVYSASENLADELGGHFMNQFKYASQATDWYGEQNMAASIFKQMSLEPYPIPEWIVCGAGTGGTSTTLTRYIRLKNLNSRVCVADPENSVFYHYWKTGDKYLQSSIGSKIEGIGRPRVEKAFNRESISEIIYVKDNYSVAAMHVLESIIGKKVGPSTGTIFYAMLVLSRGMIDLGKQGSLVGILCDSGYRYLDTYYNQDWLKANNFDIDQAKKDIQEFLVSGVPLPTWEAPPLQTPERKAFR
eukprot:TRINITY_DN13551_c0_g1_i1.p1 TRINITY_DN13551_c0_g1~~TRINITY_DN13551_c0_g1_i1.p1  ORF type:complete len:449 (+),score=77.07 TRINITY_DN13551_c0_g1_i1:114-1349(+)